MTLFCRFIEYLARERRWEKLTKILVNRPAVSRQKVTSVSASIRAKVWNVVNYKEQSISAKVGGNVF